MDFPLTAIFNFSTFELVLAALLLIPTVYVMITGAPFVPTQMKQVKRMLKAANPKPGMKVYDLGAGDGRLVHMASRDYKADAVGIEFSPLVWAWSKIYKLLFWRGSNAKTRYGNMWKTDVSDADIIVCYLLPGTMDKMHQLIFPQLKPGTLIVSHAFRIKALEPWKSIPRVPEEKLGPVWIYKIEDKKKAKPAKK